MNFIFCYFVQCCDYFIKISTQLNAPQHKKTNQSVSNCSLTNILTTN